MNKLKSIGFALLYLTIPLGIQLIVAILLNGQFFWVGLSHPDVSLEAAVSKFQNDYGYNLILVTLCNLVMIVGVGIWYWFIPRDQRTTKPNYRKILSTKSLLCMTVMAVCSQFVASLIMMFFAITMPGKFQEYQKLMEGVDIHVLPAWATLFIVVVWAPLAEEILFRGMIYRTLRKGFSFGVAALASGIVFGIYHGNLVQFAYAALFGILLAYLYEKTESLLGCYLFHFLFNLANYGISEVQSLFPSTVVMGLIILILDCLSFFAMGGLIYAFSRIYKKKPKTKKNEEIPTEYLQN